MGWILVMFDLPVFADAEPAPPCQCLRPLEVMLHELDGERPRWRSLPPEEKLRRRWEAIPLGVARSMAFDGEPVVVEKIRAILDRIEPPALLKPGRAS